MLNQDCDHWIWVSDCNNPAIMHSGRLQRLISSLSPKASFPSLNVIINRRHPKKPKGGPGILCLDFDQRSDDVKSVLLANVDLSSANAKKRFRCCASKVEAPFASKMSGMELQGLVCSRLLYPFTDVLCLHSYCLSDLAKIARWIASWPIPENPIWQPSLVVLLHDQHLRQPNACAVAEQLLMSTIRTLTLRELSCYFSSSVFLELLNLSLSEVDKERLDQVTSAARQRRRESGLLLSNEHSNALFERAFESVGTLLQQPFDPIRSSRRDFPVSANLTRHLTNFMTHLPSAEDLLLFASPVIASSLLCDHYLPNMHCKSIIRRN